MAILQLKHHKLKSIQLNTGAITQQKLKIEISFSHNVKYNLQGDTAVAELYYMLRSDDTPETFRLEATLNGIFSCAAIPDEEVKKQAHAEAYRILFPYMQSLIVDITTKAGVPPIYIPQAEITEGNTVIRSNGPIQ